MTTQVKEMGRKILVCSIAAAAAVWGTASPAHHSISVVEIGKPEWLRGTVLDFRYADPHVMFTLEVKGADGRPHKMEVEGPRIGRMERMDAGRDFLKAGDVLEVCGFHLKQPWYKAEFIHGQVLVFPDGHMRHYGPYGKLTNCLRPGDGAEKWVRFLQQDPLAMPAWCDSHKYVNVASVAPPGMVEAIDRQLGNPCR